MGIEILILCLYYEIKCFFQQFLEISRNHRDINKTRDNLQEYGEKEDNVEDYKKEDDVHNNKTSGENGDRIIGVMLAELIQYKIDIRECSNIIIFILLFVNTFYRF